MFLLNASQDLNLNHHLYKKAVELYVQKAYEQDMSRGDLTTQLFLSDPKQMVSAVITTNQAGMLAGFQEAQWFLEELGIKIHTLGQDGEQVLENTTVMTILGQAEKILAAERTLLNLLQRMSGIATYTHQFRQKMTSEVQLLATRKTLWGLLDKRAVSLGGGGTHRLNLADAVLIKDNHLSLVKDWPDRLAEVILGADEARFIEIEVDRVEMVQQVLQFFQNVSQEAKQKAVVMLDNFNPEQVKIWASPLQQVGVLVEVSGGITQENVEQYMLPGVSAVSSSTLTMEAHHLDMSLHLE